MDFGDTPLPNMATLNVETKSCFGNSGIENLTVSHHSPRMATGTSGLLTISLLLILLPTAFYPIQ